MRLSANLSCENEYYLHENKRIIFVLMAFALGLALKQRLETIQKWPISLAICTFKKSRLFPLLSGAMEGSQKGRLCLNDRVTPY